MEVSAQADTFRVVNVASNDFLSIRSTPNTDGKLTGKIPPDARGIARVGECKDWCRVRYKGNDGWVNSRYLAPDTAIDLARGSTSTTPWMTAIVTKWPKGSLGVRR